MELDFCSSRVASPLSACAAGFFNSPRVRNRKGKLEKGHMLETMVCLHLFSMGVLVALGRPVAVAFGRVDASIRDGTGRATA